MCWLQFKIPLKMIGRLVKTNWDFSTPMNKLKKLKKKWKISIPQKFIYEPRHEKMCLRESPTRQDTNWPAQLQRPARILKFWIHKLEVSFCLGSEQQRRWSDCWMHRLICAFVVCIWHKTHFLMAWLIHITPKIWTVWSKKNKQMENQIV